MGTFGPRWGRCRLCGEERELTLAHMPPKRANNIGRYTVGSIIAQLRGVERQPMAFLQGGIRDYRLCGPCNSFCGRAYDPEYIAWAWAVIPYLEHERPGVREVSLCCRRPLNFLKSALAALLTSLPAGFGDANPELVSFVRHRDTVHLPPEYDVYLTLVRSGRSRLSGLFGSADLTFFSRGKFEIACELAHPPFGFMLTLNSPRDNATGRISHLGDYLYNQRANIRFSCVLGETASPTPGDYRTDEEIRRPRPDRNAARGG